MCIVIVRRMVMTMAGGKEPTQRRVYVLPSELVDRIVEFQTEKGLPSEVEAVRRLLDEALKHRDTESTVIRRFLSRLDNIRITSEVARDVLVGHPLITEVSFGRDNVTFSMKGYGKFRIYEDKTVKEDWNGNWRDWDEIPF